MRESKIVISITTALLSIAGIALSRRYTGSSITVYYLNSHVLAPGNCFTCATKQFCTAGSGQPCTCPTGPPGPPIRAYTDNRCTHIAYFNGT